MGPQRTKVFISYSHEDARWLERLKVHLKPYERDGLIDRWDDTRIASGQDWRKEIREALDKAAVAVLLISADFLASDFIASDELPTILEDAESREHGNRVDNPEAMRLSRDIAPFWPPVSQRPRKSTY